MEPSTMCHPWLLISQDRKERPSIPSERFGASRVVLKPSQRNTQLRPQTHERQTQWTQGISDHCRDQ
ncbi:hypothetical protein VTJ04DRAFT_4156 [Mycothermus thermophilus]|uniref:uncharacterized protein n=1 Tax=Humicola insolens TaxID=85995 RepID=UPI003743D08D